MRIRKIWQEFRDDPQHFLARLRNISPAAGRRSLSYASEMMNGPLIGLRLDIEEVSPERMGVKIASGWRGQWEEGVASLGQVITLGEYMVRALWRRHWPKEMGQIAAIKVSALMDQPASLPVCLAFELKEAERESVIKSAMAQGQMELSQKVLVMTSDHIRIGEIEYVMRLRAAPSLVFFSPHK